MTKETGWAKALVWRSVKRDVGNPKKMSGLAFKATLLMLGEAEAFFSEVRTHPAFPQFAEDIGLVLCWQVHGWPPQVQRKPGTDGSNLQFSCR